MLLSPIERFVFRLELKIGAGKPFLNVIGLISIWSFSWFHLKRNNFAWKSWKSSEMNTLFIYLFMCILSLSTYRPHYRWSLFSLPRYSCGTVLRISPYSLRMRGNKDQKQLRIWTLFTQWNTTILYLCTCPYTCKNYIQKGIRLSYVSIFCMFTVKIE